MAALPAIPGRTALGARATAKDRGSVTTIAGLPESVICTVKDELPAAGGVPLWMPLADRVIPAGSWPATTANEYGEDPPSPTRGELYGWPERAPASRLVTISTAALAGGKWAQ